MRTELVAAALVLGLAGRTYAQTDSTPRTDQWTRGLSKRADVSWNAMTDAFEQKTLPGQALAIQMAMELGDSRAALRVIDKAVVAWENVDELGYAKQLRELGKIIQEYPLDARVAAIAFFANVLGPEKFAENLRGQLLAERITKASPGWRAYKNAPARGAISKTRAHSDE